MLGDAAVELEAAQQNAVNEARSHLTDGRRIEFVSRLQLFDASPSHSLCGGPLSWINGLSIPFWDGSDRKEHAYHPNALGHLATAEQVAGVVEADLGVENTPPVTTPTEAPQPTHTPTPIRAQGVNHYGIGDAFSDYCYVAWPTAPTYTQSTIQMTMHCSHQPAQFLFTSVSYDDPNLPVTPSTGNMLVEGHIVDYAQSAYGYKELVVQADRIVLPNR
jgi:hypothetical protein